MHRKKIQKLTLVRQTVRKLKQEDLSDVIGGVKPSHGGSDCVSVMICPTVICVSDVICP